MSTVTPAAMVVLVVPVVVVAAVVVMVMAGGVVEDDPVGAAPSDVEVTAVVVALPSTVVLVDVPLPESQAATTKTKVASTILIRTVCSTSVALQHVGTARSNRPGPEALIVDWGPTHPQRQNAGDGSALRCLPAGLLPAVGLAVPVAGAAWDCALSRIAVLLAGMTTSGAPLPPPINDAGGV